MKTLLILITLISIQSMAQTYTRVGTTTYGSNGAIYTQVGQVTYGNDGTSYTKVGNTTYETNPQTPQVNTYLPKSQFNAFDNEE
jgi:hypothetical protein